MNKNIFHSIIKDADTAFMWPLIFYFFMNYKG